MAHKAPGKHYRQGLSDKDFWQMFPDEDTAEAWFIAHRWPNGVRCIKCGSDNVQTGAKRKRAGFRCREKDCGKQFSTKTESFMHSSPLEYRDWLYAIYQVATNLKGVSSMKLRRNINVSQKSAWFIAHRIRKALASGSGNLFGSTVEVDETYIGGKRKNMSNAKRKELEGRGAVGKVAVVGVKDRDTNQVSAQVVPDTSRETLEGFVKRNVIPGTTIYTDEAKAYEKLANHKAVKHSVRAYVKGRVHTNGIESFWAMLKRAHMGTFHRLSPKHLHRYTDEFVGRHNMRNMDTLEQMALITSRMGESKLRYKDLIA